MSGLENGALLLTAFGPYDGGLNASEALLDSLRDDPPAELAVWVDRVAFHVFACDTETLPGQLEAALSRYRPSTCLLLGQTRQRNRLALERLAVNVRDFQVPDACGAQPCNLPVVADGPAAYRSTLPAMAEIIAAWHGAGIPAVLSNHAGTHLCNQLLYLALHRAASRGDVLDTGFLHLPVLPEQVPSEDHRSPWMSLELTRRALTIAISRLLR